MKLLTFFEVSMVFFFLPWCLFVRSLPLPALRGGFLTSDHPMFSLFSRPFRVPVRAPDEPFILWNCSYSCCCFFFFPLYSLTLYPLWVDSWKDFYQGWVPEISEPPLNIWLNFILWVFMNYVVILTLSLAACEPQKACLTRLKQVHQIQQ